MCLCFLLNKVLSFLKFLLTSLTNHPQRQRLIRARVGPEEGAASGEEGSGASGPWGRENGTAPEGERQPPEGELERGKETVGETCGGGQPKEQEEEEEEQEDQDEENVPFKPFVLPGKSRPHRKSDWDFVLILGCVSHHYAIKEIILNVSLSAKR